jgi:hypothetical protein
MDRNAVESMSLGNLAKLYNELCPEKPVKKFADRKSAVRRVLAALEERAAAEPAQPEPAKAPARTKAPRPGQKASYRQHTPSGPVRLPRPGSKRAAALALLQRPEGATPGELAARFGWSARDAADCIRLLATSNGLVTYREDGGEAWHAALPDAAEPAPVRAAAQPGPRRQTK